MPFASLRMTAVTFSSEFMFWAQSQRNRILVSHLRYDCMFWISFFSSALAADSRGRLSLREECPYFA
jgi:hypothetical protein